MGNIKNTELETELLSELLKIEALLMMLLVTRDVTVKVSEMVQLNVILKKIKETYPYVRFPVELGSECGACVYDFIMSLQPVFDRLKNQAEVEAIEADKIEADKVGSVEANKDLVNEVNPFNPKGSDKIEQLQVPAPVKKSTRGRKKKGDSE